MGFAEENEMKILNLTRGGKQSTWRVNDGTMSAIDYILANDKARRKVTEVWIDEEEEVELKSNHNRMMVSMRAGKLLQTRKRWKSRT